MLGDERLLQDTTIEAIALVSLAARAAIIAQKKGFAVHEHATQVALIASEVAEALEHVTPSGDDQIDLYANTLAYRTRRMKEYQRTATHHSDESEINDKGKLLEELADVVLRVLTYVGSNGMAEDFAQSLLAKQDQNAIRERLHGRSF